MRVLRGDDRVSAQMQRADKCLTELRQEMKRTSQKCYIAPDWLPAGQAADGLVDHRLKDGCRQVFSRSALVDERLDIRFSENAAAGRNRVDRFVIRRIFIESGRVCL